MQMSQQNSFPSSTASEWCPTQELMELPSFALSNQASVSAALVEPSPEILQAARYSFPKVAETVNHKSMSVPPHLRQENKNAYEPELISIGPRHCNKENLREMEVYKRSFLDSIQTIVSKETLEKYVDDNFDQACKCYAPGVVLEKDMMLRDGCFVVILLCEMAADTHKHIDPFFRRKWVKNALYHDLLLLENQLPFFVLEGLYRYFVKEGLYQPEDGKVDFASLALLELSKVMPGPKDWRYNYKRDHPLRINNLLSLVHNNWSPSFKYRKYRAARQANIQHDDENCFSCLNLKNRFGCLNFNCCRKEKKKVRKGLVEWQSIRTATELEEAGIIFSEGTYKFTMESLLDINFEDGTMEMPAFEIDDYTERLFRNLMALEVNEEGSTYVIDYVTLMDNLINSARDVELLRFSGVIKNKLGGDEAVARMINKLRIHVTLCADTFCYEETFVGLKKHCERRRSIWNLWKARLRRDYFNSPWAFLSFLAALLMILLTIGQFVTGLLQVTAAK